ncbi:MAG: hypothetical protein HUJ75_07705, partial [Parasporobacterium sp.]|nr:hypothetical protein [Parasporobacterium sp.]
VETGASLTTDGSLELTSYGKTGAFAETKGASQAANVMAGASTAWNLVSEDIISRIAGSVTAKGDHIKVDAKGDSTDEAASVALASGLELSTIAAALGVPSNQLSEYIKTFKAFSDKLKENSSESTWTGEKIDSFLTGLGLGLLNNTKASVMLRALYGNNAQASAPLTPDNNHGGSLTDDINITAAEAAADTTAGNKPAEEKYDLTFAASVSANSDNHHTGAFINSPLVLSGNTKLTVNAVNNTGFKSIANASDVSSETAVSVSVALMVNNNKAESKIAGNVGDAANKAKGIEVTAESNINATGAYADDVFVQAVAGAGKGNGTNVKAPAGAAALLFSGAQTIAEIGAGVTLYASDNASVKVSAKEKNR